MMSNMIMIPIVMILILCIQSLKAKTVHIELDVASATLVEKYHLDMNGCAKSDDFGCEAIDFDLKNDHSISGSIDFVNPKPLGKTHVLKGDFQVKMEDSPDIPFSFSCPVCGTGYCEIDFLIYPIKMPLRPCPMFLPAVIGKKFSIPIPLEMTSFLEENIDSLTGSGHVVIEDTNPSSAQTLLDATLSMELHTDDSEISMKK